MAADRAGGRTPTGAPIFCRWQCQTAQVLLFHFLSAADARGCRGLSHDHFICLVAQPGDARHALAQTARMQLQTKACREPARHKLQRKHGPERQAG